MTFLVADGVVPSNEDRGYVLRRVMRRAIQQGRAPGAARPGSSLRYAERVRELMGGAYPELGEQREAIDDVARLRGGGLRAHARAGHGNAATSRSTQARDGGPRAIARRGRLSRCTTRTASRSS